MASITMPLVSSDSFHKIDIINEVRLYQEMASFIKSALSGGKTCELAIGKKKTMNSIHLVLLALIQTANSQGII